MEYPKYDFVSNYGAHNILSLKTRLVLKKEPASFAFLDPVSDHNTGVAHQKTP